MTPVNQMHSSRFSAHIGFLFTEQPFLQRFVEAKAERFSAIEHPNPYSTPAALVAKALQDNGLTYAQTSLPAGDPARGEKGFAALREKRELFRGSVGPSLDYGEEIGCRHLHAMAGIIPPGVDVDILWEEYLENVAYAADVAGARGVDILIEPIGPGSIADYFISTPWMALDAVTRLNRPNVKLLFDVFHSVACGTDPIAFIREYHSDIAHVQIADFPGRHEPGTGAIDFGALFGVLDEVGYRGYVGCEYHPSTSTTESLRWMRLLEGAQQ